MYKRLATGSKHNYPFSFFTISISNKNTRNRTVCLFLKREEEHSIYNKKKVIGEKPIS